MQQKNSTARTINKVITYAGPKNQRLDVFITSQLKDIPRKKIQYAILGGSIRLNDLAVKPSTQIKSNDQVKIILRVPAIPSEIQPQADLQLPIIFQNKDFVAINKPCGLSVHPSEKERLNTVANWALAQFPEIKKVGEDPNRPGIVHRLDKATSGILVIALNQKSFSFLKQQFINRKIKKTYHAWCWGNISKKTGSISTYIGKSNANPTKQATSANPAKLVNPKDALTEYLIIKKEKNRTFVEISPRTGRKHQIRIHFQSIGHPLVGDKIYLTKEYKQKSTIYHRLMLHASRISFAYLDRKKYEFSCPLPKEFSTLA